MFESPLKNDLPIFVPKMSLRLFSVYVFTRRLASVLLCLTSNPFLIPPVSLFAGAALLPLLVQ